MDASTPFSPSPAQAEVIFAEVTLGSATLTDLAMRFNLPLCGLSDWFNSAVTVAQRQCVQTAHASAVRLAASTALCASLTRVCRRAIRPELEPPDPRDPTGARRDIRLLEILYKLCRFVPVSAAPLSGDFPKPRPPSPTSPNTPPAPGSAPSAPSAPSVKSAVTQAIQAISAISANSAASTLAQAASVTPAPAAAAEDSRDRNEAQRDAFGTVAKPVIANATESIAPAGAKEATPSEPAPNPSAVPIHASSSPAAISAPRRGHAPTPRAGNLATLAGSLTSAVTSNAAAPTAHMPVLNQKSPRPISLAPS